jgi:hypothetical protein
MLLVDSGRLRKASLEAMRKSPNDIFTLAGLDSEEPNLEEDVHGESAAIY